ncbi:uncharacterized protein BKA55DRAFT_356252 [Fusarium redolens]|uniref:Uncharacterized protein n=1 Tax=Fusarium redolens TaxID=48865 RepID=A0A9P9HBI2_FUSRE|nr:uncharacterized protein BKA55DRAFT_356252 [Fusarium redolens]KAH7254226.1 hypothetical protein BKA55DRAFT_356252 [Fusarium redolens]
MLSALPVPHRWRPSNNDSDRSFTSGLHKRFTKRLLHFYRRKRSKPDVKVTAKTKQTRNTTSTKGDDNGESIGQDKTYNALILLFNSGYPVANILARARLHIQQNVLNAHSGHLGDLGPALRIGPFLTSDLAPQKLGISTGDQHMAAMGGPSSQKRPPGSPGKSGSTSKKPRKENRHPDDRAQSDTDGDDEDDEGDPGRDGPRFPLPKSSPDRKSFVCPFYKNHPARYCKCKGLRITAISYVTQHIRRCHVLKQVTMDVQETAQSMDGNSTYLEKTKDPDKIVFYCPTCRDEFRGRGADVRWDRHTGCRKQSIAQTGVLLPVEFEKLKEEVTATSGNYRKWEKIWTTLFPGTSIPTQYNEAETGDDTQPHTIIRHQPFPGPVIETFHHPPEVFAPQMPDFTPAPDIYLGDARFIDLLNGHWDMADNIGNMDYATGHIPNPAPTDLRTIRRPARFDPNFMQSLISVSTQNPTFPNNDWTQSKYHGAQ